MGGERSEMHLYGAKSTVRSAGAPPFTCGVKVGRSRDSPPSLVAADRQAVRPARCVRGSSLVGPAEAGVRGIRLERARREAVGHARVVEAGGRDVVWRVRMKQRR